MWTIALVPSLVAVALRPRVAQPDPLGDLARPGIRDFVRSLHGD
jgi:hypothetical protein